MSIVRRNGYDSYHGRSRGRTLLKIIIAALLIILALSVGAFLLLEPYIRYSSDGVHVYLPFFQGVGQSSTSPQTPQVTVPLQVLVPEASPSPTPEPAHAFQGVQLPDAALTDGSAGQKTQAAGGSAAIFVLKSTEGKLPYASQQRLALDYDLCAADAAVNQAIQQTTGSELYTVARISCFRDNLLPQWDRDLSIHSSGGNWWDDQEIRWISPASTQVRQYVAGVCQEVAALGFDELMLDHCGFPTRGNAGSIKADSNYPKADLTAQMTAFFQQLQTALASYPELKLSVVVSYPLLTGEGDNSGLTLDLLKQYVHRVFVEVPEGQAIPVVEGLEVVPIVAQKAEQGSWAILS